MPLHRDSAQLIHLLCAWNSLTWPPLILIHCVQRSQARYNSRWLVREVVGRGLTHIHVLRLIFDEDEVVAHILGRSALAAK
eukprot:1566032-Prymnesium_polylepis.1